MSKKKVVSVTSKKDSSKKLKPTSSKYKGSSQAKSSVNELTFGRENYKWFLVGLAVIVLGLILMSGGKMPSPEVWDESIIYSFRRMVIAPVLIVAGLAIEVYAIFKAK